MPIYEYHCERCNLIWAAYHKIKDRFREYCKKCKVKGTKLISAPRVQAFKDWVYENKLEHEHVKFTSSRLRDKYLSDRGMHVLEGCEAKKMKDHSESVEHRKKPKYRVEKKVVNGVPTRVVIPE